MGDGLPEELLVVVLSGGARGKRVKMGQKLRVGKSQDNDLVLPDDTVSRHHCELERTKGGILVRDLGSTNHTRVGRTAIREALIDPGATLTVGSVELVIRTDPNRAQILPSESPHFGDVLGPSLAMRSIFGVLERIAPTDATVLIEGETGTGKDVLARAIHQQSQRKDQPFVVVDCGAVSYNLIESELFGHERGAFTGAVATRQGAFEHRGRGTLFLDEIGELPLDVQPKLLRVLETGEFRRVGGNKTLKAEARIIAATKRDLKGEVERGKFREDLYFRLAVVPITVPPLRARREDISALGRALPGGREEARPRRQHRAQPRDDQPLFPPTTGRATCASCATCSTARSTWPPPAASAGAPARPAVSARPRAPGRRASR